MLWDTDQCAAALRIEAQVLRTWAKRGDGPPSVQLGGVVRYRPADVQAWVDGLATNEDAVVEGPVEADTPPAVAAPLTSASTAPAPVPSSSSPTPSIPLPPNAAPSKAASAPRANDSSRRPARRVARGR